MRIHPDEKVILLLLQPCNRLYISACIDAVVFLFLRGEECVVVEDEVLHQFNCPWPIPLKIAIDDKGEVFNATNFGTQAGSIIGGLIAIASVVERSREGIRAYLPF